MNVLLASVTRRTRQVLDLIPSWRNSLQKAFLAVTVPKKSLYLIRGLICLLRARYLPLTVRLF